MNHYLAALLGALAGATVDTIRWRRAQHAAGKPVGWDWTMFTERVMVYAVAFLGLGISIES